jgi:hypothetical protein
MYRRKYLMGAFSSTAFVTGATRNVPSRAYSASRTEGKPDYPLSKIRGDDEAAAFLKSG